MLVQMMFISVMAIFSVSNAIDFKYTSNRLIDCRTCTRQFDDMSKLCQDSACKALEHIIMKERKISSWNSYYTHVISFMKTKFGENPSGLKIVEVGTCWGGNAASLSRSFPCSNVIAVDPFLSGYDDNDLSSKIYGRMQNQYKLSRSAFSDVYASAMFWNIANVNGRCNYDLIHATSVNGSTYFGDHTVDFIFIDGLHTYEGVVNDIQVISLPL